MKNDCRAYFTDAILARIQDVLCTENHHNYQVFVIITAIINNFYQKFHPGNVEEAMTRLLEAKRESQNYHVLGLQSYSRHIRDFKRILQPEFEFNATFPGSIQGSCPIGLPITKY